MIDRFVTRRPVETADEGVGRIVSERDVLPALISAEVTRNRFSDQ